MASTVVNSSPSNDVSTFFNPSVVSELSSYLLLSNRDCLVIPTDGDGNNPVYTEANVTFLVNYKGEDVTSEWTISTESTSHVTVSVVSNTISVTAITADTGNFVAKATKSGENTIYRKISVFKGKEGAKGDTGDTGATGSTGATGDSGASINWLGSFSTAPVSPDLNDAYRNSALGRSYVWDGDSWELMTIDGAANNVDNETVELDGSNNLKVKVFNPSLLSGVSTGAIKMTGTSGLILNSPYSVSFGGSIFGEGDLSTSVRHFVANQGSMTQDGFYMTDAAAFNSGYVYNASNAFVINDGNIGKGSLVYDEEPHYSFAHGYHSNAFWETERVFSSDTTCNTEYGAMEGKEVHLSVSTNNNSITSVYIRSSTSLYIPNYSGFSFEIDYTAVSYEGGLTDASALYRAKYYGAILNNGGASMIGTTHNTPRDVVDSFTSAHGSVPTLTISAGVGTYGPLELKVTGLSSLLIGHSIIIRGNYIRYWPT